MISIWIITSLEPDDTPKGCTVVVQQVAYVNDAAMTRRYKVQFCSSSLKVYTAASWNTSCQKRLWH